MAADFCVEALEKAIAKYGTLRIYYIRMFALDDE
jgi:hypothetical protein